MQSQHLVTHSTETFRYRKHTVYKEPYPKDEKNTIPLKGLISNYLNDENHTVVSL